MRIILTPDDLKAGELAPVGWHPAELSKYDESDASDEAQNPGSTNCNFYFKIIDGPAKGIEAKKLINEHPKSMGFNKSLWATLGFLKRPDGGYDLSTQLFEQAVGKKLKIYIKHGKSNRGNSFNDVSDFKPLT